jgi:hypothetical protein
MLYAWSPYRRLAHYAQTQKGQAGRFHPTIAQLVPGDLVFFSAYLPNGIGHVAIYAGNGMVIQAPESGRPVVRSRLTDVIAYSGTYRGATRPLTRGRQGAAPSRLTASGVPVTGGLLTIRGANLASATSVSLAGSLTYSFVQRTADRIVVRVPAHRAGPVAVAVSNPWGTARATVPYLAAPRVTRLGPSTGPTAGGTTVTVTGRHLATVTAATLDGHPLPVTVVSDVRATLTVPAHPAGAVPIVLRSPYGDANAVTYTYADPVSPSPSPSAS